MKTIWVSQEKRPTGNCRWAKCERTNAKSPLGSPGGLAESPDRSNKLVASNSSTPSSCWLITVQAQVMMPRSGRDEDVRTPCTRASRRNWSPGRTGVRQRTSPRPGEPKDSESCNAASTAMRMASAQVCQPLAMRPPQRPSAARLRSVWNHCGSYLRANSRISASVMVTGPALISMPSLKSANFIGGLPLAWMTPGGLAGSRPPVQ